MRDYNSEFEFGDEITVRNKLSRRSQHQAGRGTVKSWEPKQIDPVVGIYLGKRTLSDGTRRIYSDHIEYFPEDYFDVALVAIAGHINPFYATDIEAGDTVPRAKDENQTDLFDQEAAHE